MTDQHHKAFSYIFFVGMFLLVLITMIVSGGISYFYSTFLALPKGSGGWLYEYQTLLSGLIAAISIYIAWKNYKNDLKRKEFSARANMNDAISEVCKYARNCFRVIQDDQENFPTKCAESINILKNAIEFLDKNSSETVFELVSFYQIYNSRISSYINTENVPIPNNKEEILYNTVKLYALAVRLFSYSRNQVNSVRNDPVTHTQMVSALTNVYGFLREPPAYLDPNMETLFALIKERHCKQA